MNQLFTFLLRSASGREVSGGPFARKRIATSRIATSKRSTPSNNIAPPAEVCQVACTWWAHQGLVFPGSQLCACKTTREIPTRKRM